MNYITYAWPDKEYEFKNAKAEIYVHSRLKNNLYFLGNAEPEKPLLIKTSPKNIDSFTIFNLVLNSYQLSILEDIRNGNDLYFKLKVYGETNGDQGKGTASDEIPFYVNQSQWLDLLKSINYGEFLLFEIPVPSITKSENLRAVVDLLNQARNHFLYGLYDETVATCRKALDSLTIILDDEDKQTEAKKQFKNDKEHMSLEQRVLFIREALRHFTHLAHHVSEVGESFSFTRQEASFTLGSTAVIISFALQSSMLNNKKDFV